MAWDRLLKSWPSFDVETAYLVEPRFDVNLAGYNLVITR